MIEYILTKRRSLEKETDHRILQENLWLCLVDIKEEMIVNSGDCYCRLHVVINKRDKVTIRYQKCRKKKMSQKTRHIFRTSISDPRLYTYDSLKIIFKNMELTWKPFTTVIDQSILN